MNPNPSLSDVKARRTTIASVIKSLQAEDAQLAAIEAGLIRLFKVMATPPPPAPSAPVPFYGGGGEGLFAQPKAPSPADPAAPPPPSVVAPAETPTEAPTE